MKVVYHNMYTQVYSSDPASMAGRMESIYDVLCGDFEFIVPSSASEEDVRLVHGDEHIAHACMRLEAETECEMVAVSAGFDRHVQDWGGLLETEDY